MLLPFVTMDLINFSTLISITLREGEARESWRSVDQHEVEKIKKTPIAQWGFGVSELIETTEKVVKVCRIRRCSQLKTPSSSSLACMIDLSYIPGTKGVSCYWEMQRTQLLRYVCMVTTLQKHFLRVDGQHLGQGANQTFEDIYHLTHLLGAHPGAAEDGATLEMVFTKYERVRIPRSTMLIDAARKQGESRVVEGIEACLARNQGVRAFMSDEGVMALYAELYGDLVEKRSTL
jgi:salicylate hydroxylase